MAAMCEWSMKGWGGGVPILLRKFGTGFVFGVAIVGFPKALTDGSLFEDKIRL